MEVSKHRSAPHFHKLGYVCIETHGFGDSPLRKPPSVLGSMKVTADLQELLAASKFLDEELAKAKVHGQGQMIIDLAVKNGKRWWFDYEKYGFWFYKWITASECVWKQWMNASYGYMNREEYPILRQLNWHPFRPGLHFWRPKSQQVRPGCLGENAWKRTTWHLLALQHVLCCKSLYEVFFFFKNYIYD